MVTVVAISVVDVAVTDAVEVTCPEEVAVTEAVTVVETVEVVLAVVQVCLASIQEQRVLTNPTA
jgi:hypothetical protein